MLGITLKPKQHIIQKASLAAVIVGLLGGFSFMRLAAAAGGSIYLSPASYSVQNSGSFTVNIRVNPGTTIDSVQGTLNYEASKLQVISVNTAGSAFSTELQNSQSSGKVVFGRGDFGAGVSSDAFIESVTFKALTGSGSGSLTLSNANAANSGTYTNPGVGSATVNFTTPSCAAGQTGTPPNCVTPAPAPTTGTGTSTGSGSTPKPSTPSTPTTSSTTAPKTATNLGAASTGSSSGSGSTQNSGQPAATAPTTTQDNSTAVRVDTTDRQFTSFTVQASSEKPTQVYIKYGLDGELASQTEVSDFATTHTIGLDSKLLIPGETYSYVVVSTDQSGKIVQSERKTITMKGLTLKVKILDANRQPIRNQKVTLHSKPIIATTDDQGVATFSNATPGNHSVIYTAGTASYQQKISAVNNVVTTGTAQTSAPQSFSVAYNYTRTSNPAVIIVPILLVILAAAAGVVLQAKGLIHVRLPERLAALLPHQLQTTNAMASPVIPLAPVPTEQAIQPGIQMPPQPIEPPVIPIPTEVPAPITITAAPAAPVVPSPTAQPASPSVAPQPVAAPVTPAPLIHGTNTSPTPGTVFVPDEQPTDDHRIG